MTNPLSGYRPVTVVTRKGKTIKGVAKNEDGFSIQILDFQNQLHLYDTADYVDRSRTTSLMPHHYDKNCPPTSHRIW